MVKFTSEVHQPMVYKFAQHARNENGEFGTEAPSTVGRTGTKFAAVAYATGTPSMWLLWVCYDPSHDTRSPPAVLHKEGRGASPLHRERRMPNVLDDAGALQPGGGNRRDVLTPHSGRRSREVLAEIVPPERTWRPGPSHQWRASETKNGTVG